MHKTYVINDQYTRLEIIITVAHVANHARETFSHAWSTIEMYAAAIVERVAAHGSTSLRPPWPEVHHHNPKTNSMHAHEHPKKLNT